MQNRKLMPSWHHRKHRWCTLLIWRVTWCSNAMCHSFANWSVYACIGCISEDYRLHHSVAMGVCVCEETAGQVPAGSDNIIKIWSFKGNSNLSKLCERVCVCVHRYWGQDIVLSHTCMDSRIIYWMVSFLMAHKLQLTWGTICAHIYGWMADA